MEQGEQASKLSRPPKEWPMRLSVPGDSRTLLWHGFRCTSMRLNLAACGEKDLWRTVVIATAEWEGAGHLASARAVLRPGDTFNRVLGKRLALSRLVKLLIPGKGAGERKKRGKLFLALAPTPRAPRLSSHLSIDVECKPVNGKSGFIDSKLGFVSHDFYRRMNGLKLPTEQDLRDTLSRINKEQRGGAK